MRPTAEAALTETSLACQASFDEYYAEQPWLALPFAKSSVKEKLSKMFKVQQHPGADANTPYSPYHRTISSSGLHANTPVSDANTRSLQSSS